jgi:putative transposase
MYAALVETAGYLPVALQADDYIELLPPRWRAINAYGIKIDRRTYDSPELNPLRGQGSAVTRRRGLWEIHHDPYDVSRIYVRGPQGWLTVFWRHLDRVPVPFGDLAWDHARRNAEAPGRPATEEQIADAVAALLQRAYTGPGQTTTGMSKRDRRVAARTKTTTPRPVSSGPTAPSDQVTPGDQMARPARPDRKHAPATQPDHDEAPAPGQEHRGHDEEQVDTGMAKVIPLGIFDPFKEAERRW